MPKGLYEYEVLEDGKNTVALTLLRGCRVKLAVSEEKVTELPDEEIQCRGVNSYEYALKFFEDDIYSLPNAAAEYFTEVPCVVSGRGKGSLPYESGLLEIDNKRLHVTALKRADNGEGTVVRLYNPTETEQSFTLKTKLGKEIFECSMDETVKNRLDENITVKPKKIVTLIIR